MHERRLDAAGLCAGRGGADTSILRIFVSTVPGVVNGASAPPLFYEDASWLSRIVDLRILAAPRPGCTCGAARRLVGIIAAAREWHHL
jgi:hypothetical protein